ncbi:MAG TPA: hypothetical protein VKY65_04580 [Alphaproteobacteria bacterium]|nr:hypothetical protein [Alphaproteobacteria bacterium]
MPVKRRLSAGWILTVAIALLLLGILGQWAGLLPIPLHPDFTSLGGANR